MAPKLYANDLSPVVRSIFLVSKAIGLKLEQVEVNLAAGEHLTPEYLKINPQHTVPALVDGDFAIWDSHAINTYLIGKYAKDDSLYPKDLKKRAVIDQRLHFDSGVLFATARAIIYPILRLGATSVPQNLVDQTLEAYAFLEAFLEGKKYIAADQLTLADLQIIPTLSQIDVLVPISEKSFPRVIKWWNLVKTLPYYKECNEVGLDKFAAFIKSKLA